MGSGITLKCPKCSFKKAYHMGVGFMFPRVYDRVVKAIKNYDYGAEWLDFFRDHPGAAIDAKKELYHCRLCNAIIDDYNLDLYESKNGTPPENGYVALWADLDHEYEFVKHYTHHCPICDGRMKRIHTKKDFDAIPCPRCGTTLIAKQDFMWD